VDPSNDYTLLIEWLKEKGHSEAEILRILAKVRQYDERTMHDSVMDSIGSGQMTLDAIIKEALEQ
jgi:hypothetical protein